MLGWEILDVALGLVFIYLLLSLIASAVREAAEMVIKARAVHLERGIREMLQDPTGAEWACKIYTHPYVSSLFKDTYNRKRTRWVGWNLPTYIPARSFAAALVDTVVRGEVPDDASTATCGDAPNGARKVARGDAKNGDHSRVADDNVTADGNAAVRVAVTDGAIGPQEIALTIESLRLRPRVSRTRDYDA
jgi:hypothetical protein